VFALNGDIRNVPWVKILTDRIKNAGENRTIFGHRLLSSLKSRRSGSISIAL
jgi:hypothetical protein